MSESRINNNDTEADKQLHECLIGSKKNFLMIAGAGSGKTTSLIKALNLIIKKYGEEFKRDKKRVACITYTEVAAGEILADISNNPLVHVSTIHSFMWSIIRHFQADIKTWLLEHIDNKICELNKDAEGFGPRVKQSTREKNSNDIKRYEQYKEITKTKTIFTYGIASNYREAILGHDDIIKISIYFLNNHELFRKLVAQQFPFIFIDESQDTTENIVGAFVKITEEMDKDFCLGFFGDPMQKIYVSGIGKIAEYEGWEIITKPENFRCSQSVLNVANQIRNRYDRLQQTFFENNAPGSARIFIIPDDDNDDNVEKIKNFIAIQTSDGEWLEPKEVKELVLVHRRSAEKLGFSNLYTAMNDKAPSKFKDGFLEGTSWPLKIFLQFIIPLTDAVKEKQEFETIEILRKNCHLLKKENLEGKEIINLLARLKEAANNLAEALDKCTIKDALEIVRKANLCDIDQRIISYMDINLDEIEKPKDEDEKELNSMKKFFECQVEEFFPYKKYIKEESPFSTQQGVKGEQFDRVLVHINGGKSDHNQFSYDKFFDVEPESKTDIENRENGKETTIERTRNLFYVCCTRAQKDLAVIYFSPETEKAIEKVIESGYFPISEIYTIKDGEIVNVSTG